MKPKKINENISLDAFYNINAPEEYKNSNEFKKCYKMIQNGTSTLFNYLLANKQIDLKMCFLLTVQDSYDKWLKGGKNENVI